LNWIATPPRREPFSHRPLTLTAVDRFSISAAANPSRSARGWTNAAGGSSPRSPERTSVQAGRSRTNPPSARRVWSLTSRLLPCCENRFGLQSNLCRCRLIVKGEFAIGGLAAALLFGDDALAAEPPHQVPGRHTLANAASHSVVGNRVSSTEQDSDYEQ